MKVKKIGPKKLVKKNFGTKKNLGEKVFGSKKNFAFKSTKLSDLVKFDTYDLSLVYLGDPLQLGC